jgi:flagellar basal-body rod protein FlgC
MKKVFEPHHPFADEDGYITKPNVNVVDEMVNMMSASRSYQNNVDLMNTTKSLLQKTLTIGQ